MLQWHAPSAGGRKDCAALNPLLLSTCYVYQAARALHLLHLLLPPLLSLPPLLLQSCTPPPVADVRHRPSHAPPRDRDCPYYCAAWIVNFSRGTSTGDLTNFQSPLFVWVGPVHRRRTLLHSSLGCKEHVPRYCHGEQPSEQQGANHGLPRKIQPQWSLNTHASARWAPCGPQCMAVRAPASTPASPGPRPRRARNLH
jgi:hypothetical protein